MLGRLGNGFGWTAPGLEPIGRGRPWPKRSGLASAQRIWRAHGLQPHRVRQFRLSNDPRFVAKLRRRTQIGGRAVDYTDRTDRASDASAS
jgi:hypothetical protein